MAPRKSSSSVLTVQSRPSETTTSPSTIHASLRLWRCSVCTMRSSFGAHIREGRWIFCGRILFGDSRGLLPYHLVVAGINLNVNTVRGWRLARHASQASFAELTFLKRTSSQPWKNPFWCRMHQEHVYHPKTVCCSRAVQIRILRSWYNLQEVYQVWFEVLLFHWGRCTLSAGV